MTNKSVVSRLEIRRLREYDESRGLSHILMEAKVNSNFHYAAENSGRVEVRMQFTYTNGHNGELIGILEVEGDISLNDYPGRSPLVSGKPLTAQPAEFLQTVEQMVMEDLILPAGLAARAAKLPAPMPVFSFFRTRTDESPATRDENAKPARPAAKA